MKQHPKVPLLSETLYILQFDQPVTILSGTATIRLFHEPNGSDITTQTVVHLQAGDSPAITTWTYHHP